MIETIRFRSYEAAELHRIVAVIKASTGVVISERTRKIVDDIDAAATGVERAHKPLADLEKTAAHLKELRDATAHPYEESLKVFQRRVRSAADDGPREMYATIFGRPAGRKKAVKTPEAAAKSEAAS